MWWLYRIKATIRILRVSEPSHQLCRAGPGAPDLLTLRAVERLKQADVLIWTDSLICPDIIRHAPQTCESIRTSTLTLEQVVPLLVDRHQQGKRVVRLHDGDTALYSAINEQICALCDRSIPVDVVPGVSAYQGNRCRPCQ